ncbi:hypothetical protein EW145_g3406 [Phellinidium pouzarii]|uniref:ZW10 C-terminal helical domain-containing protein n=1 Tax=Phellinidium pouzarii TaxID=167371 RepID=A0A4S4L7M2_9AGAM|nr:hypothetical protein EW145_g3406 [Phellinidium pouzarii]
MAFPVPDHLPRKGLPQDVSSQILSKVADTSRRALTADLTSKWVSELELSIKQTKDRIHERIHDELPDFERQLELSRSAQTRLQDLSTNVDKLSDELSNPETGLLPKLVVSLEAHSKLAQHASNARTVHDALSYLSKCSDGFEALTLLVNDGKLAEGVDSGEKVFKMLESAPEVLAKADVMVDMKKQLRALKDRVEEQLSEAYSRSIRISSTEFHISPSVQVRQCQTIITLQDILSSLSDISLNSNLTSLRRDIVTYFIDFPLQQAISSNISRAPDTNGTPSICISLFPLPPHPDFRKSTIDYLRVFFDFIYTHLFSALPPSTHNSFHQSLYRATAAAILRDVLIPSLPSNLNAVPTFISLEGDILQGNGDIQTWALSVATHYGRKRRVDLLAATRTLVLSSRGVDERTVRVEVSQKLEEGLKEHPRDVIPVQGSINGGDEDGAEDSWYFDVSNASGVADSTSKDTEDGKLEDTEVDETRWEFDNIEDSNRDAPQAEPEGDNEGQDDSDVWGWGDGDKEALGEQNSTLATSGNDSNSIHKSVSHTNGNKPNGTGLPAGTALGDPAWDDAWDEPSVTEPTFPPPTQSLSPPKQPKHAKRLEKFSKKGKGLASPSGTSSSSSSPFTASPAFPSSVSSTSFHTSHSPRQDSTYSSPQKIHIPSSHSETGPPKPAVLSLYQKVPKPETYIVSGRAQDLVHLIADVFSEDCQTACTSAFSDFISPSSTDTSASTLPSTLILQTAPFALDLYRAVYPVTFSSELSRPDCALRFANDCSYISEEIAKLEVPECAVSTIHEHMRGSLERLRKLGEWWFEEGVERQREHVLQLLVRAEGFVDTSDQERFDECEGMMSEVLRDVRAVAQQWKTVLPRTKSYHATGQVVEAALTRILGDVLALRDIPEIDSRRLSELCRILNALEGLFVDADDPDMSSVVLAYVPSWLKFSYLSELLEASMSDISYLFDEGALIDFRVEELVSLVRALFADTPLRASTIAKLQRGHPVVADLRFSVTLDYHQFTMHRLRRDGTVRSASPPPMSAPSPLAPHAPQQQQQQSPNGLKALGRRMSHSKPLRMLKTIASKSSLRGHGRRKSSSSVNSMQSVQSLLSQDQGEVRHEEKNVAGPPIPQVDTPPPSTPQPASQQQGIAQEVQVQPVVEVDKMKETHEAETRPQVVEEPETVKRGPEQNAHVEQEQASVDQAPQEPAANPESSVDVANTVQESGHVDSQTAGSSLVTRVVAANDVDESSLSSSSTTVDLPPAAPAPTPGLDKIKLIKMDASVADQVIDIDLFLVDDPDSEDPLSEHESGPEQEVTSAAEVSSPAKSETPLAESIVLSQTNSAASPPATSPQDAPVDLQPAPVVDVNPDKTISTPPASSGVSSDESSSSEEEAPELHTPALTLSTLFLPVPNPHLRPPRNISGEWQHTDFHTLVMTNNWRALARMARDRIISTNPRDTELILNLWYIRLSSLARLRLFNQTAAECENLFSVLATIEPPAARAHVFSRVLPFELEVLRTRCAYWAGDQVGYLDDLVALLRRCRSQSRMARDAAERSMWKERGSRMALIVASQLVEMKDYTAAASLLEPLCASGAEPPAPALRSALARIYLQGGHLTAAATHFAAVEADPVAEPALKGMNAVLRAAAEGDWTASAMHARALVEGEPESVVAVNNYAVALLCLGKVKEGIQVLENTLQLSPFATTTAEPYLFNLSTMYELRAALAVHKKRDLLVEVAKWSGDGLRTACLKLNS